MQTEALKLAKHASQTGEPERISWGLVEFQVVHLDQTVEFWSKSFGLTIHSIDKKSATLGTKNKALFIFHAGATEAVSRGYLGMYHVALGVPGQNEFSRLLSRLISMNVPFSLVDHLMSKAIYLHDPNGLEIEIAFETPERFGGFYDLSKGLTLLDKQGQPHSGRAPLDIKTELSYAHDLNIDEPLSEEAFLSHIHFKVAELDSATSWFEELGFARNLMLPKIGIADMGAGADYTHRVAMNIWDGPHIRPAPINMARLTHYELYIHNPTLLEDIDPSQNSTLGLKRKDPSGTEVTLIPAY